MATKHVNAIAALQDHGQSAHVHAELLSAGAAEHGPPHVLIYLAGRDGDQEVMRQGRVLAARLQARLTCLYVFCLGAETRRREALARDRLLARQWGVPVIELPAFSEVDGLVEFAQSRGVTQLVVGESGQGTRPAAHVERALREILHRLNGVDLYLVSTDGRPSAAHGRG